MSDEITRCITRTLTAMAPIPVDDAKRWAEKTAEVLVEQLQAEGHID